MKDFVLFTQDGEIIGSGTSTDANLHLPDLALDITELENKPAVLANKRWYRVVATVDGFVIQEKSQAEKDALQQQQPFVLQRRLLS